MAHIRPASKGKFRIFLHVGKGKYQSHRSALLATNLARTPVRPLPQACEESAMHLPHLGWTQFLASRGRSTARVQHSF